MKDRLIVMFLFLSLPLACAEKKAFKGAVATGRNNEKVEPDKPTGIPNPVTPTPNTEPPTDGGKTKTLLGSKEFKIETSAASEVDMVWVIDNSSSMANEISQVRSNLDRFMESLSSRVDIKVQLISADETVSPQLGLSLSSKAKAAGHIQHPFEVGSTDPVDKLGVAVCPESDTHLPSTQQEMDAYTANTRDGSPFKICEMEIKPITWLQKALEAKTYELSAKSLSLLRPTAAKVFVFVTDDDALTTISPENFESVLKLPKGSVHVFGFVGLNKTASCSIAKPGEWYKKAAAATGGGIFDLCASDWSEHFLKLSANVVQIAGNSFKLDPKPALKAIRVTLDNKILASDAYMVEGTVIRILNTDLLKGGKIIKVDYSYEQEEP